MIAALGHAFPEAKVHVVPNRLPPHRSSVAASEHRLAMLDLVLVDVPQVFVDRIEMDRPGPSYAVDTLRTLRMAMGEEESLVLCMGADAARSLDRWHEAELIPSLAHLCVLSRAGVGASMPRPFAQLPQVIEPRALFGAAKGLVLHLQTPVIPVSSTRVRQCIAEGADVWPVPDSVRHYIETHCLYRNEDD